MAEIATVGLDRAKNVFQAHAAGGSGGAVRCKTLRRDRVVAVPGPLPPCIVAREACGGAHFRGREIGKPGHRVRPGPPVHGKAFVKRRKNDDEKDRGTRGAAQADERRRGDLHSRHAPDGAFCAREERRDPGAALAMALEPVARHGTMVRIREGLIRQRTQAINVACAKHAFGMTCAKHAFGMTCAKHAFGVTRGHLAGFGQIVPQGTANAARRIAIVEDPDRGLPAGAIPPLKGLAAALTHLETGIDTLDTGIARRASENGVARRLMTVPGIGPLIATAIAVLAPRPFLIPGDAA